MKTAVSIPDRVFRAADQLARKLKVSRSELYATAVAAFVAKHDAAAITAALDEVYADDDAALDPVLRRAQAKAIRGERW